MNTISKMGYTNYLNIPVGIKHVIIIEDKIIKIKEFNG